MTAQISTMTGQKPARPGEVKFMPSVLSDVEKDGTFSGYASLFGERDLAGDIIERGAFARSIARRGPGGIKLLYQHDPALPIGNFSEIREDDRGLFVRGQLLSDVSKAREVLALMRAGALDGLSIGFTTLRARKDRKAATRHVLEVDLWEISVVTFPLLPAARIASVKAAGSADRLGPTITARLRAATRLIQSS